MQHTSRQLLIDQRTAVSNSLRSQLAEFGVIASKGEESIDTLMRMVDEGGEALGSVPPIAVRVLRVFVARLRAVREQIDAIDDQIKAWQGASGPAQAVSTVPGIGPLTSAALAAHVPDPRMFRTGRDFAAWLGLVPRQNSSGGKERLGRITKQGNQYPRRLLVLGATASLRWLGKRTDPLAAWSRELLRRRPARLATVAIANKMARIAWAIMTTGELYRGQAQPAT